MSTGVARRQQEQQLPGLAHQGETMTDMIQRLASEEGIPVTGITILGGKPYINVTGLDCKLRSKCESEKLVHAGTEYIPTQEATKENGMRAGGWGVIKLFDKRGFEKALELAGSPVTKEVLDTLKELYHYVFRMRGFASPETLQMANMKLKDNIEHMAERRATNRAKREATGTGLTSVEEMNDTDEIPTPEKRNGADPITSQTASTSGTKPEPSVKPVDSQAPPASPGKSPPVDPMAWVDEYERAINAAVDEDSIKLAEFNARGAYAKALPETQSAAKERMFALKKLKEERLAIFLEPKANESQVAARRAIIDGLVAEFGQERFLKVANDAGLRGESDRWSLEKLNEVSQVLRSEPW